MALEPGLIAAFLVGLFGGVHCIGMCGGIVTALTLGSRPAGEAPSVRALLPTLLGYNLGRLLSYALAGALFGALGLLAAELLPVRQAQTVLAGLAGGFMLLLGLYIGGWWAGLARLERLGGLLWKRVEPLGRELLPIRHPGHAILLGMLWGWLPCGLVYSVLIWALTAGGPGHGALLLLAFGLGTLPALLAMGGAAAALSRFVNHCRVRSAAGLLVILFGLHMLGQAIWYH